MRYGPYMSVNNPHIQTMDPNVQRNFEEVQVLSDPIDGKRTQ